MRVRFLEAIAAAGWLRAGSAVDEALADPTKACVDPQPACLRNYPNSVERLGNVRTIANADQPLRADRHQLAAAAEHQRGIASKLYPSIGKAL